MSYLVEFSSEKNRYNFVPKKMSGRKVEMLVSTRKSSENEVTKCWHSTFVLLQHLVNSMHSKMLQVVMPSVKCICRWCVFLIPCQLSADVILVVLNLFKTFVILIDRY